jgi:hypothetical protein
MREDVVGHLPSRDAPGPAHNAGNADAAFLPRKGVAPPPGQDITSAALSVEHITIVFSVMPRSSHFFSSCPTCPSCSTMPSGEMPRPVLSWLSAFSRVQMCMRVAVNQVKNSVLLRCARSMLGVR